MKLNCKILCHLYLKYIFVFISIFFLDFATKIGVKYFLTEGEKYTIIPNFFDLQLVFNTGVAFSLPIPYIIQIILSVIIIGVIVYWARYYFMEVSNHERLGVTFLLAGASANLWERIIAQHVTDFLHFYHHMYFDVNFAIFNIADIFIFFGVVIWYWGSLQRK